MGMTKKNTSITQRQIVGRSDEPILAALRLEFYQSVTEVMRSVRSKAYRAVDFAMIAAHWNSGRMIVNEEQKGIGGLDMVIESKRGLEISVL